MNKKEFKKLKSGTLVCFQGEIYRVLSSGNKLMTFFNKNKGLENQLGIILIHDHTNTFTFVKTIDGFRYESSHFEFDMVTIIDHSN